MTETRSALSGLMVVDLSTGLAAALASMFLADNGARVVRLVTDEEDAVREPAVFAAYDRGKEVVYLDPNTDSSTFSELVSEPDVVLDDFTASSPVRSQLGLDSLTKSHPRLVHCSITAYGASGPLRDEPADHDLVAARTGILANQPSYRGGPIHVVHPVAYVGAGLLATMGIAAALYRRERDGRGGRVETSLMAGALLYTPKAVGDRIPVRLMNMTPQGGGPFYSIFECSDGEWIQIGCIHSGFVDLAAAVIGVADDIASNPEFGDGRWPRSEGARKRLFDKVAAAIRTRAASEWIELLQAADVPCDLSQSVESAMRDPQIRHNDLVQTLDDPVFGRTEMSGLPIKLSETPGRIRGPRAGSSDSRTNISPPPSQSVSPETQSDGGRGLPLRGVRIMEMTNVIAGPVAGRLLADLGADMVKFESLDGDISRPAGGAGFIAFNANKRSVSANTRTDSGKQIARRLAASSDAILANMRPGATHRMGLDDATLGELNSGLIQTHITAYGWDGPYAQRPGVDPIAQAITGLQQAQGGYDGPPVYLSALAPCDYTGGALGALGTVLALVARARFGVGQKVDTNLLAAGVVMGVEGFIRYEGKLPRRLPDCDQLGISPLRRLYKVSDGWVFVAADSDDRRPTPQDSGGRDLSQELAGTSVTEALGKLTSLGIPSAPVIEGYTAAFSSDPQATANKMVTSLRHPTLGVITLSGNLVSFDGLDTLPRRSTPLLGQHTDEVLSDLGYTPRQIRELHSDGVVKSEAPS